MGHKPVARSRWP